MVLCESAAIIVDGQELLPQVEPELEQVKNSVAPAPSSVRTTFFTSSVVPLVPRLSKMYTPLLRTTVDAVLPVPWKSVVPAITARREQYSCTVKSRGIICLSAASGARRQGSPIRIAYRSIVLGARRLTACDTLNRITIRVFEVDLSVPKYFAAARGAEGACIDYGASANILTVKNQTYSQSNRNIDRSCLHLLSYCC